MHGCEGFFYLGLDWLDLISNWSLISADTNGHHEHDDEEEHGMEEWRLPYSIPWTFHHVSLPLLPSCHRLLHVSRFYLLFCWFLLLKYINDDLWVLTLSTFRGTEYFSVKKTDNDLKFQWFIEHEFWGRGDCIFDLKRIFYFPIPSLILPHLISLLCLSPSSSHSLPSSSSHAVVFALSLSSPQSTRTRPQWC